MVESGVYRKRGRVNGKLLFCAIELQNLPNLNSFGLLCNILHFLLICVCRTFVPLHSPSVSGMCVPSNNWQCPPLAQQGRIRPVMACCCSRGDQLLLRGLRAGSRFQNAGASILPLHAAPSWSLLRQSPLLRAEKPFLPAVCFSPTSPVHNPRGESSPVPCSCEPLLSASFCFCAD